MVEAARFPPAEPAAADRRRPRGADPARPATSTGPRRAIAPGSALSGPTTRPAIGWSHQGLSSAPTATTSRPDNDAAEAFAVLYVVVSAWRRRRRSRCGASSGNSSPSTASVPDETGHRRPRKANASWEIAEDQYRVVPWCWRSGRSRRSSPCVPPVNLPRRTTRAGACAVRSIPLRGRAAQRRNRPGGSDADRRLEIDDDVVLSQGVTLCGEELRRPFGADADLILRLLVPRRRRRFVACSCQTRCQRQRHRQPHHHGPGPYSAAASASPTPPVVERRRAGGPAAYRRTVPDRPRQAHRGRP